MRPFLFLLLVIVGIIFLLLSSQYLFNMHSDNALIVIPVLVIGVGAVLSFFFVDLAHEGDNGED